MTVSLTVYREAVSSTEFDAIYSCRASLTIYREAAVLIVYGENEASVKVYKEAEVAQLLS